MTNAATRRGSVFAGASGQQPGDDRFQREQQVKHALQDAQRAGGEIQGMGQDQAAADEARGGDSGGCDQAARRKQLAQQGHGLLALAFLAHLGDDAVGDFQQVLVSCWRPRC
jgi:hypothetical protein